MPKQTKQVIVQALTLQSFSDLLDKKLDQKLDEKLDKRFGELGAQLHTKFEAIDKKFDAIDQRFVQIDQRFEKIDQRFEKIDQRFEKIDQRFEQFDQRFNVLEIKLDQTNVAVKDLREDMDIVKDFLTTQVMTKTEGREIMTIVSRHTKEIKELQAIAGY